MDRKFVLLAVVLLCGVVSALSIDLAEFRSNAIEADDSLLLAPAQQKKEAEKKTPAKKGEKKVSADVTKLPPGQFVEQQKGMDCQTVALKKPFCVKPAKKVCKDSKKCVKFGEFQRVCKRKCLHREKIPKVNCSTTKKNVCKKYYKKPKKTFKCLKWAKHAKVHKKKKTCAKWVYKPSNARDCKKKGKGSAISCKTFDRTPVCAKWKKSSKGDTEHRKYCAKMKTVMKKVCKHIKKITKKVCTHLENKGAGKTFCAVRAKELSCHSFKPCKEYKKAKTCERGCAKSVKTVYACKKITKKEEKPKAGDVPSAHAQRIKQIAEECERRWSACRAAGGKHHECFKKESIAKVCGDKGISANCQFYGFKCRWGNEVEKKKYCPQAKACGQPLTSASVTKYLNGSLKTFKVACAKGLSTCKHNNSGKDDAWCLANKPKVKSACDKVKEYETKIANLKKKLSADKKEEKKKEEKPATQQKKKF